MDLLRAHDAGKPGPPLMSGLTRCSRRCLHLPTPVGPRDALEKPVCDYVSEPDRVRGRSAIRAGARIWSLDLACKVAPGVRPFASLPGRSRFVWTFARIWPLGDLGRPKSPQGARPSRICPASLAIQGTLRVSGHWVTSCKVARRCFNLHERSGAAAHHAPATSPPDQPSLHLRRRHPQDARRGSAVRPRRRWTYPMPPNN